MVKGGGSMETTRARNITWPVSCTLETTWILIDESSLLLIKSSPSWKITSFLLTKKVYD